MLTLICQSYLFDQKIDQGRTIEEETPKEKEQEAIQTLINLPTTGTPIGTNQ